MLFGGIRTHEPLLPQLADVVHAAIVETGTRPEIVTAGISGLTDRDADAGALLALLRDTGIREAALAHDSTTSFLGALGDTRGAVVAAGTGVVTLAVGRDAIARVDGWGHIMGDAGSGYWIGREALDAVMRGYDGRGPDTALVDVVRERWPELDQAYIALQATDDRVRVVASFAADVARLAEEGDPVALDHHRGGRPSSSPTAWRRRSAGWRVPTITSRCARSAASSARGCSRARSLPRCCGGEHGAVVTLVAPQGEGIEGAVALADLPPGHPLSAGVHSARA